MPTSETPSVTKSYPKWDEIVAKFPLRWRPALSGSVAKLVPFHDRGFIIDVNGFDDPTFSAACADPGFRSEITKNCVPWALNHPAGRPRICWGITFGQNLAEDEARKILVIECGATLTGLTPKRYPMPESE
jgi:hypothetical protein